MISIVNYLFESKKEDDEDLKNGLKEIVRKDRQKLGPIETVVGASGIGAGLGLKKFGDDVGGSGGRAFALLGAGVAGTSAVGLAARKLYKMYKNKKK